MTARKLNCAERAESVAFIPVYWPTSEELGPPDWTRSPAQREFQIWSAEEPMFIGFHCLGETGSKMRPSPFQTLIKEESGTKLETWIQTTSHMWDTYVTYLNKVYLYCRMFAEYLLLVPSWVNCKWGRRPFPCWVTVCRVGVGGILIESWPGQEMIEALHRRARGSSMRGEETSFQISKKRINSREEENYVTENKIPPSPISNSNSGTSKLKMGRSIFNNL